MNKQLETAQIILRIILLHTAFSAIMFHDYTRAYELTGA